MIDGAVNSRGKCRMGVSAGFLRHRLTLTGGQAGAHTCVGMYAPIRMLAEGTCRRREQQACLLPNLTPTFFPRGVLA